MKTAILLLLIPFFTFCQSNNNQIDQNIRSFGTENINTKDYQLIKPDKKTKAVLILFGGFPENAEDIQREFKIVDVAKENNIAVLFMNFNRKLWLEESEKKELAILLQNTITENELPINNIYIGGFSSGGTISLLLSNFIAGTKEFDIDPKGVFIIDSPIDLLGLHNVASRTVTKSEGTPFVEESKWLLETLSKKLGNPIDSITAFEKYSVYTSETGKINNLRNLKDTKIRLYTEPDIEWWKKNAKVDYEDMNAYFIKKLSKVLKKEFDNSKVEFISTSNKGYRANGDRNPHSWSIVDKKELISWMLKKD